MHICGNALDIARPIRKENHHKIISAPLFLDSLWRWHQHPCLIIAHALMIFTIRWKDFRRAIYRCCLTQLSKFYALNIRQR